MPIVFVQGNQDISFPWDGGIAGDNVLLSMAQTVSTWTFLNACRTEPEVTLLPDSVGDGTQVQIDRYTGCRDDSEVTLYAVFGGGHTWPGSPGPWPEFLGIVSQEIDAGAEIIAFFERHQGL
jgi:polyhydroxybutyrate depolymerase